ncbi:unnamed protein product [Sphagnum compactum]
MELENSIYVGGLAYDSKEEVVKKAFVEYGDLVSVKIVYDRGSGGSRGFGFVTFKNSRAAVNAIREMNGNQIAGRTVRVNEVRKNRLLGFRDRENGDRRDGRRNGRDGRGPRSRHGRSSCSPPSSRVPRARSPLQRQRSRSPRAAGASPLRYKSLLFTRDRTPSPMSQSSSPQSSNDAVMQRTDGASREAVAAAAQAVNNRANAKNNNKDDVNILRHELERESENRQILEDKVGSLKGTVERVEQNIAILHTKAQKLQDSLATALQVATHRQNHLRKLQSGISHYKTCFERLASSEKEIKALATTTTVDTEGHGIIRVDEEDEADVVVFTNGCTHPTGSEFLLVTAT